MIDKWKEALDYISSRHVAEAGGRAKKRSIRPWLGAIAAVLALALLFLIPGAPIAMGVKAVSPAEYPDYEWKHRPEAQEASVSLLDFFQTSMTATLSKGGEENLAYSPINLYMALTLAAELTGGSTRQQILSALGSGDAEALRQQANLIWNACYLDDNDQTLLANSVWLDEALPYRQETMDLLAENYYTSVYSADLGGEPANRAIAKWLDQQTGGLLKQDTAGIDLSAETVLALYSTVYYQAKWGYESDFNPANNTKGIFHSPAGDQECTFMNRKERQTTYYWGEDYGAVSLWLNGNSQMWFILPDEGKTVEDVLAAGEFINSLFYQPTEEAYGPVNSKYMKVNFTVPKFDIHAAGELKEDLQAMGITEMFQPYQADFSPTLKETFPLWVDTVNQATRVAIDEEGVTAASYIEFPAAGAAPPPEEVIDFVLDRPFLFVITNRYDLPLFAGVVNQPNG